MLSVTAVLLVRGRDEHGSDADADDPRRPAEAHQAIGWLAGSYHDGHTGRLVAYQAQRIPATSAVALGAGAVSGMLGVGGGFLKVPAMNLVMRLPLKVAASTSNFMVGITALASLFIYIEGGFFHPYAAAPVVVGVMAGALLGARLQHHSSPKVLRVVLAVVLAFVAVQMLLRAAG